VPKGFFTLVLHAHLPFVRHPEHEGCFEEDWLFEAITEVYLPLLDALARLAAEGVEARLAMSISPTLCEMLSDDLLRTRYTRRLDDLLALAERELARTFRDAPQFFPAAKLNFDNLRATKKLWEETYTRDLVRAFRDLQDAGALEIMTCAATHALLPLVSTVEARRAQVCVAAANYRRHFGRAPRGIWLPECAYAEGLEKILAAAGLEYFVADAHAVLHGEPRPRYGVHAPVRCANGVAVFARDLETSEQVWSSMVGYPGDPAYREFYRDLGWDAPLKELPARLRTSDERRPLGLKYHRVTGRDVPLSEKLPYDPAVAAARARTHARHFVTERVKQVARLCGALGGRAPLIVSPYDAELFGHWWFEGVQFIEWVLRFLHERREEISTVTPGDYLDAGATLQTQQLSASSWGEDGYYKVWLSPQNAWVYPHQHAAEARMTALANRFAQDSATNPMARDANSNDAGGRGANIKHAGTNINHASAQIDLTNTNDSTANLSGANDSTALRARSLKQCARELLLAQASDWAFQIYQGTTADYAARRFRSHIARFNALADEIERGEIDVRQLEEIERRDNIFAHLDHEIFRSQQEAQRAAS
jgi:1,4-alpha-glucan branching enzyme